MSYLATQNLCCTKLIMSKLKEFPQSVEKQLNTHFAKHIQNGNFQIKTFTLRVMCRSKHSIFLLICQIEHKANFDKYNMVVFSDFVRFAVLDIYEGIYVDGDVVLLKDMRMLWDINFALKWSNARIFLYLKIT